jgi:hypothetical protein
MIVLKEIKKLSYFLKTRPGGKNLTKAKYKRVVNLLGKVFIAQSLLYIPNNFAYLHIIGMSET